MLTIAGKTDIGMRRADNEDSFYAAKLSDETAFAVVCDGMGGKNGGAIASQTAVATIKSILEEGYRDDFNENTTKNLMFTAVESANSKVFSMSRENTSLQGMGTTAVLAVIHGNLIQIAYAGDSRAYLIEKSGIRQITRDHSIVQMMVDRGEISREEAQFHPQKRFITRAVGVEETLDIDYLEERMPESGTLLLCTDGLSNALDDEQILDLVRNGDFSLAPERLISKANAMGGFDNITAVLINW